MTDQRRESAVYLAMLAEKSKRYNETVEAMKSVALMDLELTEEERRLLSVGYKMMFGARCTALRTLAAIESKEVSNGNHRNVRQIKDYAAKLEAELTQIREGLVSTLRDHVIPSATSAHDHVFYHKMIGDAYRFCAEFKTGVDEEDLGNHGLTAYMLGTARVEELRATNATRLGLGYGLSLEYLDAALTEIAANIHEDQPQESRELLSLLDALVTHWNHVLIFKEGHKGSQPAEIHTAKTTSAVHDLTKFFKVGHSMQPKVPPPWTLLAIRANDSWLYNYTKSFSGFAAKLSMEGVVSVFPNSKTGLHTRRSWEFMGLLENVERAETESDIIVGVIDSGIWHESPSFSDKDLDPPPTKWKGICQSSSNFTDFSSKL
ncbi:hypothetical protein C2S52_012959 [Perilla frutescens var. hirtella]|nr:hypothetical protein C2S52_012959 [Perilla frutescens var. hirtella]